MNILYYKKKKILIIHGYIIKLQILNIYLVLNIILLKSNMILFSMMKI